MVDKMLHKYGYEKVDEDKHGVTYINAKNNRFNHIVCIHYKTSGKHIMQSYDDKVHYADGQYLNCVCGVEIPVLLLLWLKGKYLARKYHWNKL